MEKDPKPITRTPEQEELFWQGVQEKWNARAELDQKQRDREAWERKETEAKKDAGIMGWLRRTRKALFPGGPSYTDPDPDAVERLRNDLM